MQASQRMQAQAQSQQQQQAGKMMPMLIPGHGQMGQGMAAQMLQPRSAHQGGAAGPPGVGPGGGGGRRALLRHAWAWGARARLPA